MSALLNHIVKDFFERSQVVVETNGRQLPYQSVIGLFLRPFIAQSLLKVRQLLLPDVFLVDLKTVASLAKLGRFGVKFQALNLPQLSDWLQEVVDTQFLSCFG